MSTISGSNGIDTVDTIYYVGTPKAAYYGNSTQSVLPITSSTANSYSGQATVLSSVITTSSSSSTISETLPTNSQTGDAKSVATVTALLSSSETALSPSSATIDQISSVNSQPAGGRTQNIKSVVITTVSGQVTSYTTTCPLSGNDLPTESNTQDYATDSSPGKFTSVMITSTPSAVYSSNNEISQIAETSSAGQTPNPPSSGSPSNRKIESPFTTAVSPSGEGVSNKMDQPQSTTGIAPSSETISNSVAQTASVASPTYVAKTEAGISSASSSPKFTRATSLPVATTVTSGAHSNVGSVSPYSQVSLSQHSGSTVTSSRLTVSSVSTYEGMGNKMKVGLLLALPLALI